MSGVVVNAVARAVGLSLLLAIAVRVPLVVSGNFVADGDEAIVGLLAHHLRAGGPPTLFLYGQSYGLALVEAATAAVLDGLGIPIGPALKWGAFVIWLVGLAALIVTARRWWGEAAAMTSGVLLATLPAWGNWALRARSGYVTAFAAAGLAALFASSPGDLRKERSRDFRAAAAGACAGLAMASQPLWIPVIIGASLVLLARPNRRKLIVGGCAGTGVFALLMALGSGAAAWNPAPRALENPLISLRWLPVRLEEIFAGTFVTGHAQAVGWLNQAVAWIWTAILGLSIGRVATRWQRGEAGTAEKALLLSILAMLVTTSALPSESFSARYLLPLGAPIALLAGHALSLLSRSTRIGVVSIFVIANAGAIALQSRMITFAPPGTTHEAAALAELVETLENAGIHDVYSTHPTLQWALMSTSRERIAARWFDPADRCPEYPLLVDGAFRAGRSVALVGPIADAAPVRRVAGEATWTKARVIRGQFFILAHPAPGLLDALGFEATRTRLECAQVEACDGCPHR